MVRNRWVLLAIALLAASAFARDLPDKTRTPGVANPTVTQDNNKGVVPMSDTLQILEKVNAFYNSAWSQLVFNMTIMLAIVGGLIPVLITMYQNRKFKIEQEAVKKRQAESLEQLKADVLLALKEDLKVSSAEIEKRLNEKVATLLAGTTAKILHLQGNGNRTANLYAPAARDYARAATHFLKANEEGNLRGAVGNIVKCLPFLDSEQMENTEFLAEYLNDLVTALENGNTNDRFLHDLLALRRETKAARVRPKKSASSPPA